MEWNLAERQNDSQFAPRVVQGRWDIVPEQMANVILKSASQCRPKKNSYTPEGRRCRKIKHTMRKLDHKYKFSKLFLFS